jgi:hypothetical protein
LTLLSISILKDIIHFRSGLINNWILVFAIFLIKKKEFRGLIIRWNQVVENCLGFLQNFVSSLRFSSKNPDLLGMPPSPEPVITTINYSKLVVISIKDMISSIHEKPVKSDPTLSGFIKLNKIVNCRISS